MPPTLGDIVVGSLAVIVGCVGGAAAVRSASRSGNWFGYLCALGCAAFVAGVIGQRTYPSEQAVRTLGPTAAAASLPGPFDAGVSVPVIGVHITPVAAGGLLAAALGLSLLLLFERVQTGPPRMRAEPAPLDDDDSV